MRLTSSESQLMIKKKRNFFFILCCCLIAITFVSCVENYWPELAPEYEKILVVDGTITNLPGPYEVKLSLVSHVQDPEFIPYSRCRVMITSDKGEYENLFELSPGVYSTSTYGIQGACGVSYKLTIITPTQEVYVSDFETMAFPTGIDSIYTEVDYKQHPDLNRNIIGLQFFVDTQTAESDSTYFFWDLESTHKYKSNYRINYYFDGHLNPFYPSDSLNTCYQTKKTEGIYIFNTSILSDPRVTK